MLKAFFKKEKYLEKLIFVVAEFIFKLVMELVDGRISYCKYVYCKYTVNMLIVSFTLGKFSSILVC